MLWQNVKMQIYDMLYAIPTCYSYIHSHNPFHVKLFITIYPVTLHEYYDL